MHHESPMEKHLCAENRETGSGPSTCNEQEARRATTWASATGRIISTPGHSLSSSSRTHVSKGTLSMQLLQPETWAARPPSLPANPPQHPGCFSLSAHFFLSVNTTSHLFQPALISPGLLQELPTMRAKESLDTPTGPHIFRQSSSMTFPQCAGRCNEHWIQTG